MSRCGVEIVTNLCVFLFMFNLLAKLKLWVFKKRKKICAINFIAFKLTNWEMMIQAKRKKNIKLTQVMCVQIIIPHVTIFCLNLFWRTIFLSQDSNSSHISPFLWYFTRYIKWKRAMLKHAPFHFNLIDILPMIFQRIRTFIYWWWLSEFSWKLVMWPYIAMELRHVTWTWRY